MHQGVSQAFTPTFRANLQHRVSRYNLVPQSLRIHMRSPVHQWANVTIPNQSPTPSSVPHNVAFIFILILIFTFIFCFLLFLETFSRRSPPSLSDILHEQVVFGGKFLNAMDTGALDESPLLSGSPLTTVLLHKPYQWCRRALELIRREILAVN